MQNIYCNLNNVSDETPGNYSFWPEKSQNGQKWFQKWEWRRNNENKIIFLFVVRKNFYMVKAYEK